MRNRPLYAFDAEADAMQRWHAVSSQVAEELREGCITPLFGPGSRSVTGTVAAEVGATGA